MTSRKSKMKSRAGDGKPDQKWVVEYLVQREGQRRTAALLGVNRKTVALALTRERLTGKMALAVQRFMAGLDDPYGERATPLDRLEARMRRTLKAVDDLRNLVDGLTERVEALEAAREAEDDAKGGGLRLFDRWRRRRPQGEDENDG